MGKLDFNLKRETDELRRPLRSNRDRNVALAESALPSNSDIKPTDSEERSPMQLRPPTDSEAIIANARSIGPLIEEEPTNLRWSDASPTMSSH